jgi:hypothetical protein
LAGAVAVPQEGSNNVRMNYFNVTQFTEDDACDKPYVGPSWEANKGLLMVAESNYIRDPERQAWVRYFLRGGYDRTFGVIVDCVMCAGVISRQKAMANVCFLNYLAVLSSKDDKEFKRLAQKSEALFENRVRQYPSKAVWLIGNSHHEYSAPIVRDVLGIEPVLSVHPSYYIRNQNAEKGEAIMVRLREDWKRVQAQLETAAV